MRTVKLLTVAFMLALAGAVYAAGAKQDNAKPPETTKAEKSCCKKHAGTPASANAVAKHSAGCCCKGDSCGGASRAARHDGTWAAAMKTAAASVDEASCCGTGSACCAGGSCCKGRDTSGATVTSCDGESCCKEGAACCEGAGKNCCNAHKAGNAAGAKGMMASCSGSSCGCGRTQEGGR